MFFDFSATIHPTTHEHVSTTAARRVCICRVRWAVYRRFQNPNFAPQRVPALLAHGTYGKAAAGRSSCTV